VTILQCARLTGLFRIGPFRLVPNKRAEANASRGETRNLCMEQGRIGGHFPSGERSDPFRHDSRVGRKSLKGNL